MAKSTRSREALAIDTEEVTTRRRRRIPPDSTDVALPLDLWLAQMAALPSVTRIIANKRQAGGKYSRLAEGTLEPPFDFDQDKFFKRYGDGDYKFSVLVEDPGSHRQTWHNHRFETVAGYGNVEQTAAAGAGGGLDPTAELTEMLKVKRLGLVSRYIDRELEVLDGRSSAAAAAPAGSDEDAFDRQLDRFAKIAVLMHKGPGAGGGSKLEEVFATWVPKLFEKIIPGAAEPAEKSLAGLEKMLDFADRLASRNGPGDFPDMNTLLVLGVLGMMGNPQVQAMVNQMLGRVIPGVRVAAPTAGAHARPRPTAEPAAVPAAADPGSPEPTAAAATSSEQNAVAVLRGFIWPMIRRAIELESENFESYADVIDNHLEGFLDAWAGMELEAAIAYVAPLEPEFIAEPKARAWLSRFHAYLVENPPDETPPAPGAASGS
jgi:hypothetical protein